MRCVCVCGGASASERKGHTVGPPIRVLASLPGPVAEDAASGAIGAGAPQSAGRCWRWAGRTPQLGRARPWSAEKRCSACSQRSTVSQEQLRTGAHRCPKSSCARGCSGACPKQATWLGSCVRPLLRPPGRADLPHPVRAAGYHGRGGASNPPSIAAPERGDGAEAAGTASGASAHPPAELRTVPFLRSRALRHALTASARELWPFFARFSAPSLAWIARVGRVRSSQINVCPLSHCLCIYIQSQVRAAADILRRLAQ